MLGISKSIFCLGALVLAGVAGAQPAEAGCDFVSRGFRASFPDAYADMYTDAKGCVINLRAGGGMSFDSAEIVSQPAHGKLVMASGFRFDFKPAPGFTGNDAFQLRTCGSDIGQKGCTVHHMKVIVR